MFGHAPHVPLHSYCVGHTRLYHVLSTSTFLLSKISHRHDFPSWVMIVGEFWLVPFSGWNRQVDYHPCYPVFDGPCPTSSMYSDVAYDMFQYCFHEECDDLAARWPGYCLSFQHWQRRR